MEYKYCVVALPTADMSKVPELTTDIREKNKRAKRDSNGVIEGVFNFDSLRKSIDGTKVMAFQDIDEPWHQILLDSENTTFLTQAEADALIPTPEWTDPNEEI